MSLDEADVFGRYLLGGDIDSRTRTLYVRAATELGYDGDDDVSRYAKMHPWTISALDGALAVSNSDALLRKKLLLMAAILETQPAYAELFLARERAPADLLVLVYRVVRAWAIALLGCVLLRLVR